MEVGRWRIPFFVAPIRVLRAISELGDLRPGCITGRIPARLLRLSAVPSGLEPAGTGVGRGGHGCLTRSARMMAAVGAESSFEQGEIRRAKQLELLEVCALAVPVLCIEIVAEHVPAERHLRRAEHLIRRSAAFSGENPGIHRHHWSGHVRFRELADAQRVQHSGTADHSLRRERAEGRTERQR